MFAAIFVTGGRMRAGWRALLFAVVAALLLVADDAVLRRLPATAPLFERAPAGSISVLVTLLSVGSTLILVLGLTALVARMERRSLACYGLPIDAAFRRPFRIGVLWGLALATLTIGATALLGGLSFGAPELSASGIVLYAIGWGVAFVLVGVAEELLFRGYALSALSAGIGFWPAAVVLAAAFGGLHLLNDGEGFLGALNVVCYALFASFTLQRTGNLWFAIGMHAAWDYAQSFLYGVPDSGMRAEGHLLQADLHGPSWLTGGTVGPEGSLLGFAALGLAFVVFARRFPPRPPGALRESPHEASRR
jgi:membrane protease YdiL (CAAX protease family)